MNTITDLSQVRHVAHRNVSPLGRPTSGVSHESLDQFAEDPRPSATPPAPLAKRKRPLVADSRHLIRSSRAVTRTRPPPIAKGKRQEERAAVTLLMCSSR